VGTGFLNVFVQGRQPLNLLKNNHSLKVANTIDLRSLAVAAYW
jgi:hypothetical protein